MEKPLPSDLTISIVTPEMDLSLFSCSESELNEFLYENAFIDTQNYYSVTRVVLYKNSIVGYFTLIADSVSIDGLDDAAHPGYNYSKLPAVKIARLATDERFVRCGIGRYMMQEIITIAFLLTQYIGCKVITVDVKPDALPYYESFAFQKVKSKNRHETIPLYLDIKSLID